MTPQELAYEVEKGLGLSGVEGGYGSVSKSTAGDYPSMGFQQLEGLGGRGDNLLGYIDGGQKFIGRTYSDIREAGQLNDLSELLNSPQGQEAQNIIAKDDCLSYVNMLTNIEGFDDSRCIIYAGMWCPTSTYIVQRFVTKNNTMDLGRLYQAFRDAYYIDAGYRNNSGVKKGYQDRADKTFQYVSSIDLTTPYGVSVYGG